MSGLYIQPLACMQAARHAYDTLQPDDQAAIAALAADLRGWLHELCPGSAAGTGACLEIIAAISQALNERGWEAVSGTCTIDSGLACYREPVGRRDCSGCGRLKQRIATLEEALRLTVDYWDLPAAKFVAKHGSLGPREIAARARAALAMGGGTGTTT